jgi:replicative DNA helicase
MLTLSQTIIKNLIFNDVFARRAAPFIKPEYFEDVTERHIFSKVQNFYVKYNNLPTVTAITLELDQETTVTEDQFRRAGEILTSIANSSSKENNDWLNEQTEKFCKERAMINAIMDSIKVMDDIKNSKGNKEIAHIEQLVTDALSVSFDPDIGTDYLGDSDARFKNYHLVLDRMKFDLLKFNEITNGGLPKKTLSVIVAGTNVGKSLCLCHFSAAALAQGKNVLYISMEMSEDEVAKRIDANLLDFTMEELKIIPKSSYDSRMNKLKSKTLGNLRIKEYSPGAAHSGHFRHLIGELKLTKNFVPDLICVDYLTICSSSRIKVSGGANTNTYFKMVAEELRGLAREQNCPLITAAQLNRGGFGSSDPGMDDLAEAFSISQTADWMVTIVRNEELDAKGQYMVKQIKSRLSDATSYSKFLIGVDRSKQRLFDLSATDAIDDVDLDPPSAQDPPWQTFKKKGSKKDFSSFNF